MKKSVAIINDELGTMALGFSKAGYDVTTILNDYRNKNSNSVCKENWGDIAREYDPFDYSQHKLDIPSGIDCLAIRIKYKGFSIAGTKHRSEKDSMYLSKVLSTIESVNPKCFVLQCTCGNRKDAEFSEFVMRIERLGYDVEIELLDTRFITGFPVNERATFIIGTMNFDYVNLNLLRNNDIPNYCIDQFFDKVSEKDEWFYRIPERYLYDIEWEKHSGILCWSGKHYKEEAYVKWNCINIPLLFQGDRIRKITHREIARIKGIPEEYVLPIRNKSDFYKKLMYCSNVQLIQQLASSICLIDVEKNIIDREVNKGIHFEQILLSYFNKKGLKSTEEDIDSNSYIDFQIEKDNNTYAFVFKIYPNNVKIENKVLNISENLCKNESLEGKTLILVIGNIVDIKTKEYVQEKLNICVWDIENILWLLEEYLQLKSEFEALLSFNISKVVPKKPENVMINQNGEKELSVDWQERLRKVKPGKDDANKYEVLCDEIVKYLFSNNIEFLGTQKKANDGLYRFDDCGKIKTESTSEFFSTIQQFFNTKYIVFEFKNYQNVITQKEIYTTEKYLYEKALRKVAIIISRKGMDENAKKAVRGSIREQGKLIICLSDEDVNKLIDIKRKEEEASNYLESLLDEMLMDLEK